MYELASCRCLKDRCEVFVFAPSYDRLPSTGLSSLDVIFMSSTNLTLKTKTELRRLSPQAKYMDRATAACQRS
jgi:hypothetical protein